MARNIEIKARISSVDALAERVAALADEGPIAIAQDDTFFPCPNGRLKLRTFSASHGELIFYRRADAAGPKESYYLLSSTAEPDVLRNLMTQAYGQAGRVVKQRTLFLVGRTRVHLDEVVGLGHFMELEVVLEDGEAPEDGIRDAHTLMERLGVDAAELVEGAYVDLKASLGPVNT